MSSAEKCEKLRKWQEIQAWLRAGAAEPLTIEGSIAACVCDAVSWRDGLRMLLRYLVVCLAQRFPVSAGKVWLLRRLGARIGRDVFISPGVIFDPLFPELITIDDGVLLGLGCRLLTHEYTATSFRLGRIHIGDGAVVGAWAMVRSGVSVGRLATIGAYSFANKNIPDGETVGGVPAHPLRKKMEI